MSEHTVKSFDDDLHALDRLIRDMGLLAAEMVEQSAGHLAEAGADTTEQLRTQDLRMDEMQREVDARAVTLIATRQPMAQDLRAIVCAIRIAGEFERIGDLARNISRRAATVGEVPALAPVGRQLVAISNMAHDQVASMVALYAARDAAQLDALRDRDEAIDTAYLQALRDLLAIMASVPGITVAGSHLLFCAKNLERIGDHVTNIAEDTHYMITGNQLPPNRPKRNEFGGS